MRFMLASVTLAFGGLCVVMQTYSVTGELGVGSYLKGKVLQVLFSAIISSLVGYLLFSSDSKAIISKSLSSSLLLFTIFLVYFYRRKKVVAFRGRMLYNNGSKSN